MFFDINLYQPTVLEKWICDKYQENGINVPSDMDLDQIASIYNSIIKPTAGRTKVFYDDEYGGIIYLNQRGQPDQQRVDFFHELCHPARHSGSQKQLPRTFVDLQEAQAGAFQLYAAMPYYMLADITPCYTYNDYYALLSETFRLPLDFVERRIDQVQRRILQGHHDRNLNARLASVSFRCGYSDDTLRILNQLHGQLRKQQKALD